MLVQGHTQDIRDMDIAKDVAESLHRHYPGHLWAVNVQGGIIGIRNLAISHSHGMVVHLDTYYQDPGNKKIIMSAGELLERAHLKRGRDDGDQAIILEGVAEKYQPRDGIVR